MEGKGEFLEKGLFLQPGRLEYQVSALILEIVRKESTAKFEFVILWKLKSFLKVRFM